MKSPWESHEYGMRAGGGGRPDSGVHGGVFVARAPDLMPGHAVLANPQHMRKAAPADFLLPITKTWLQSLPGPAQPRQLALYHPRLANGFAAAWPDLPSVSLLFVDLLAARNPPRRGFDPEVMADITTLWEYWCLRATATPH